MENSPPSAVSSRLSTTTADASLARAEAVTFVEGFVERLGPKYRDVFIMSQVEGIGAPDIAEVLELKLNTVYSRIRTVRTKFERAVERRRKAEGRRG